MLNTLQHNFVLIAVTSALFASIANLMARTLLKNIKSQNILGINFLTMGTTLLLVSPLFYKFNATFQSMALVLLIALIDTVANFFYFKTFEKTEASVASPLLSLAPAFTFVFGWIFINDTVSIQTYLLSAAIICTVVVFSTDFKDIHKFKKASLLPALLSSSLFGLSAIPSKYLLNSLGAINSPTLYMFRAGFIAMFSLIIFGFPVKNVSAKQYRIIFLRGLFVIAQWLLLYYALTIGNAGVSVTLANITPIFVFIFAALLLKEKITLKKVAAATLILVFSVLI